MPVTAVRDEGALRMWVHRLPVHIVPEEVANLTQSSVKLVYSAGTMRRPQASFEAQPRAARLLAPKIGIDPYKQTRKLSA